MRWPKLAATLPMTALIFGAAATSEVVGAAEPQVVDRVVAVVEREPILLSDLAARADPVVLQMRARAKSTAEAAKVRGTVYREMLQEMIDERLIDLHAADQGIVVTKSEVDGALQSVAHQNGMTPTELLEAVKEQTKMSADDYRATLRRSILGYKVIRREIDDLPADADAMAALVARTQAALLKRLRGERYWAVRVRFQ